MATTVTATADATAAASGSGSAVTADKGGNEWQALVTAAYDAAAKQHRGSKRSVPCTYESAEADEAAAAAALAAAAAALAAAAAAAATPSRPKPRPKSGYYGVSASGRKW